MSRRAFMSGAAAFALTGRNSAVSVPRSERPAAEFRAIQREIDDLPSNVFMDFVHGQYASADKSKMTDAECEAAYARYPILRRYDDAFREVMCEVQATKVLATPAIWYVYNMGVIVKTQKSLFSIDLCHRLAPTIADELDFAIISHRQCEESALFIHVLSL